MLIRPASSADWPGIWSFLQRILLARDTYAWDPAMSSDEGRELWMKPPPAQVCVAEDDGVVVGTAVWRPNYGPGSKIANASYLVDPDRAGQGIGRQLVHHTLTAARSAGYRGMVFNAVVQTNVNAVHLYESMGFTILGTVPEGFEHPTQGPVGLHVMYCKL